jgi:hypothetical protein
MRKPAIKPAVAIILIIKPTRVNLPKPTGIRI